MARTAAPQLTPAERSLRARIAAHEKWAQTADPSAATAKARQALHDRFQREVDPEGVLAPDERVRRAEHARKAYYTRLALKSARARRARSWANQLEAEVSSAMSELDEAADIA